jgi:hypothetical protein
VVLKVMVAVRVDRPRQDMEAHRQGRHERDELARAAVERVLAPDAEQFTLPVGDVARLLRMLTFSGSHPLISQGDMLTPQQITSVVLDGVRRPSARTPS